MSDDARIFTEEEVAQKMVVEHTNKLQLQKINERYVTRRMLADAKLQPLLGQIQKEIEETESFLKFLNDTYAS